MSGFARIFAVLLFVFCFGLTASAAVFTVTKTADTNDGVCDADCSLREAVAAANAVSSDDEISFSALFNTSQTIALGGSEIVVAANGSLTINGPGANLLTISGSNMSRILSSSANAVVNINNLKFTAGNGVGAANTGRGGAIYNVGGTMVITNSILTGNTAANGGAINNAASASPSVPANLTIINCVISNNTSSSSGGGMQNFSTSTMIINNSTISGNTSGGTTGGGAMQANGTVKITNSTIFGNNAPGGSGGGIAYNGTSLILTNITISGNTSTSNGGGIHKSTSTLNAFVRNSIFAGNNGPAATPDITGIFNSEGNNIIGNVGTSTGWVMSDLQNVNPILAPFGFYGGFGNTFALLSGSPALNAGQNCVTDLSCATNNPPVAVTTDQRGAARPFNTTVDIGAFEANTNYIAVLPNATLSAPYNFPLATGFTGFGFFTTSGTFGGILLVNNGTSAILDGTSNQLGTYNPVVRVTNNVNFIDINYQLTVSAVGANVSVIGKAVDAFGNPARGAVVSLTDSGNITRYTKVTTLGYFTFDGVPFGANYTLNAVAKGLTFNAVNFTTNATPTVVNLVAQTTTLEEGNK